MATFATLVIDAAAAEPGLNEFATHARANPNWLDISAAL
jgi:hypothetical protein